jgi:hypothetical protein
MGLGNWFNRYILEVKDKPGAEGEVKAEDPPEARAKAVDLVSTQPASEVITDLPEPDFSALGAELAAPVTEPEPAAEPPPLPAEAFKDPMDDGEDPPVSIAQVYAASKLGPPDHGFSLEKIAGMLADPRMAALDETARANAIAVVLEASGVKLAEVVKDAAGRDAALDRFEGFMTDKLITMEVEVDKANSELEAEIQRLIERKREQMEANKTRIEVKERELARFRRVKRAEEARLFEVVRHFTSENPVTITQLGGSPPAGA